MNLAYVRVSTIEQNEARQVEALERYNIEKWFIDKTSAKDTNRPQLKSMLEYAREGDIIYIHDFSRLARNTADLLRIVEEFNSKNIQLISHKESLDTSTPTGRLMLTVIAAINEFEREIIIERQREGIELAKKRGVYKGRREVNIPDFEDHYKKYKSREITKKQLAEALSISRPTLDKIIKKHEE